MTRTLFDIGADFEALDRLLNEITLGDCLWPPGADKSHEMLNVWFEQLSQDEARKMDNYCEYIATLEMEEAAAKAQAEQFAMKARQRAKRIDWLKARMKEYMERVGRNKIATEKGRTVSVQANGGKEPLILEEAIDIQTVPHDYIVLKKELDKEAIRAALLAGMKLPFAHLGERGTQLRIR